MYYSGYSHLQPKAATLEACLGAWGSLPRILAFVRKADW